MLFKIKTLAVLVAASFNADTNGAGVDLGDFIGSGKFVLNAGQATGNANATADMKLQHSDTSGGTYTDVTGGAFLQVTNAMASGSHQEILVNRDSLKRWVRVVVDVGGTTPVIVCGVSYIGKKRSI